MLTLLANVPDSTNSVLRTAVESALDIFRGERHRRVIENELDSHAKMPDLIRGESCRRESVHARLRFHDDTDCRKDRVRILLSEI
jgi:hypothetical protein